VWQLFNDVASYKMPADFVSIEKVPRSNAGKTLRNKLKCGLPQIDRRLRSFSLGALRQKSRSPFLAA
jgi:hypothetical protein